MNDNESCGLKCKNAVDAVIGRRIAERRRQLGLSEASLAQLFGIELVDYLAIESGHLRASAEQLASVCNAIGLTVPQLFEHAQTTTQQLPPCKPVKGEHR